MDAADRRILDRTGTGTRMLVRVPVQRYHKISTLRRLETSRR